MVNFGERLKGLRQDMGITQTELAKRLNVTKSVVSYYELQERMPSPEIMVRLSDIFHVTTDYLLGVEHKKLLDVSDLEDEDIHFLHVAIETLRRKNEKNK